MSLILDRVAAVYRLSRDSNNSKKESYKLYTPLNQISLNVQPSSAEDTIAAEGVFGQAYIAFTTYSGVLEGDKLILQPTGETLMVKGKTNWMGSDLIPHIELLLTEFETSE